MATEKQETALIKTVENGGNITQAMRDAGYSEATINNPSNLTQSKGWQELIEEHLPDDLLARVTKEGLGAGRETTNEEGRTVVHPDFAVRHRYLETALKVKDKFPNKKIDLMDGELAILGITYVTPTTDKPE